MWDRADLLNRAADTLILLAAALIVYGIGYQAIRLPAFTLREVRLAEPLNHVSAQEIEGIVRRDLRGNFFTLDLARTRAAFETLPWVRAAHIRRKWPDAIEVSLVEHLPLARWGTAALVSSRGEVFAATYAGPLPVFHGPDGAAKEMAIQYEYFRSNLAAIGRLPVQVRVSARGAWQILLDGGTTLELGREHIEARLSRFVAVYQRTVAPLDRPIDYVDLRYANGFAVSIPELRSGSARKSRERT